MSNPDSDPPADRLERQIGFILEIDRLKKVGRQSYLTDASRKENSAEHSWHVALMALVLGEYAPEPVDLPKVVRMLLIHDLVEIDAGDTFLYDAEANADKRQREQAAADRIYSLLPEDQAARLLALWQEFEEAGSPEARFARSLDRLMPLLHNVQTRGRSWQEHGIPAARVLERLTPDLQRGSPQLWRFARELLEKAEAAGYFAPEAPQQP